MSPVRLREPLVSLRPDEDPDEYAERVLAAAREVGGRSPVIRLQLNEAFVFSSNPASLVYCCALWVDRNPDGRSPSWQKVSVTITGDTYRDATALFIAAMDRVPVAESLD